jgi:hypothetical protein
MISVVVGTTSGVAFAGSDALTLQGAAAMWRAMGYVVGVLTIKNDPDFDGTDVESIFNLTDRNKIKWTRKFLATIGYDGDISSLIDGLEEYAGLPVSITIQVSDRINSFTGDPYLKVWVNQRLGEVHGPVSDVTDDEDVQALKAQSTSPYTADDDIPF